MPKGVPLSPEHRAKLSAIRKGVPKSPQHRAAISAARKGQTPAASTRAAVSAANKVRVPGPVQREKVRIAMRGNTHVQDATVKGECVYCLGVAQTYDHVIPRGRPGWDDPDNMVPACFVCNSAKADRTPEEWFAGAPTGRWR